MQPVVYSKVRETRDNVGWLRGGSHTRYYKNSNRVTFAKNERYYYTLTWKYTCEEDDDTVYFAHCYPYTYTDLQTYLTRLSQDPARAAICRQRELCRTLAGNICDLLTITEYGCPSEEMKLRKGIVVTARVHPGESNASWMMKGFLDFITSGHPDARTLRQHFIFKVVPMLNPDGVIAGNYRTSLAGVDLNRVYTSSNGPLYPTIHALKLAMKRLRQDRTVVLYVDLHGHSRKQNMFVYGCNNSQRPAYLLRERVFPKMLSLNGPSHFYYRDCKFNVKANKESTGRVNTWRELGLLNAFTLEATFCGSTIGELRHTQFNCRDFEHIGEILCDTILDYCDPNSAKKAKILLEIRATPKEADDDGDGDSSAEGSLGSDSSDSDGATELAEIRFKTQALKSVGRQSFSGDLAALLTSPPPPPPAGDAPVRPKSKKQLKSRKDRDSLHAAAASRAGGSGSTTEKEVDSDGNKSSKDDPPQKKTVRASKMFVSKFSGRGGSGMPTFTEEQAIERRKLKMLRQEALPVFGSAGYSNGSHSPNAGSSPGVASPGGVASPVMGAAAMAALASMEDPSGGSAGQPAPASADNKGAKISRARTNNTIIARYLAAVNMENNKPGRGDGQGRGSDGGGSRRPPDKGFQELQVVPARSLDLNLPGPSRHRYGGDYRAYQDEPLEPTSPPAPNPVFVTAQPDLVQATLELLRQRVHDERRRSQGSASASPEDWHHVKHRMVMSRRKASMSSPPTSPMAVPPTQFDLDVPLPVHPGSGGPAHAHHAGAVRPRTASFQPQRLRGLRASETSEGDPAGGDLLEETAKQRKHRQSVSSGLRDFELAELDALGMEVAVGELAQPSGRAVAAAGMRPASSVEARRREAEAAAGRPFTASGSRQSAAAGENGRRGSMAAGSSLRAVHELRKTRPNGSAS